MRVTSAALPPVARDHVKPAAAGQARFKLNGTPDAAGNSPEKVAVPARAADRQMPPGLDRMMTRLESIPQENRTAGQVNALDRIGRNIARYQENHGLAVPVVSPPVVETPPAAPEVPPAETAGDTPAAPVVDAAPLDPPAAVPVETLPAPSVETPAEAVETAPVVDAAPVAVPVTDTSAVDAAVVDVVVDAAVIDAVVDVAAADPAAIDNAAAIADAAMIEATLAALVETAVTDAPVAADPPPAGTIIDVQA